MAFTNLSLEGDNGRFIACCSSNIFVILLICCFVVSFLSFNYEPFALEKYNFDFKNWKLSPIESISIDNEALNKFLSSEEEIKFDLIKLKRVSSKYNYQYLFFNKNTKNHPCGYDNYGNFLFMPNKKECPINFVELSYNEYPNISFDFKTIKIKNNLFLHYSNQNINGYLYNDISFNITYCRFCREGYSLEYGINIILKKQQYYGIKNKYRNLEKFYIIAALHLKEMKLTLECFTIFFLIFFILFCICSIKGCIFLDICNFFILVIEILMKVIAKIYINENIILIDYDENYESNKKVKYNEYSLISFSLLCAYYLAVSSLFEKTNYYYLITFCFREGCNLSEKLGNKLNKIDKEIYDIDSNFEKNKNKKDNLTEQNCRILNLIKEKTVILNSLKEKEKEIEQNLKEIKIKERSLQEKEDENINKYKKKLAEINKFEEEIYNFKMIIFKDKIYDKYK